MRKRTQLVGFEFGYWKHVQYCAEFTDNALDAIESFQWKELQKSDSKVKFSLDQELFLEKLSIIETIKEEKKSQQLNNEAKLTLMQEFGIESVEPEVSIIQEPEEKEEESGEIIDKEELEVEEEVKRIIDDMQEIIKPVEYIIDVEPIVCVRIREYEAPSFLTSEISQKNIMSYTFEVFDNGTGMSKIDLRKFGRYLASSKSLELKQTRGSQGFGAPSAFSDAQNTTGKPVITVSKSIDNVYATVTEFFTTSKNEKKYLIHPTDVDSPFLHGTYIKLSYLNVKYVKGYVEKYIEETAFMNPHVTIIYIDPDGKEKIYRRLATSFPEEPKYAKPHPSSVNIGDLQDLITKSENKTISAFLQDNFVRMSSKTAKEIVDIAERNLQDQLKFLILKDGFVNLTQKKTDPIYFMRNEKRIFGRSDKPRDKLIVYHVDSDDLKEKYWNLISNYNKFNKEYEKINKEIKKLNNRIDKSETKKEIKSIEGNIKKLLKNIEDIRNQKDIIKVDLNKLFKETKEGITELKKLKNRTDFEDLVDKVQLSKVKPIEITKEQFNSLFLAFKSIKYMSPPTDTAIPVGESTLENTLIKEIGLRISENVDDFAGPVDNIYQLSKLLYKDKKKQLLEKGIKIDDDTRSSISIDSEEIINLNSEILGRMEIIDNTIDSQQVDQFINDLITYTDTDSIDTYHSVYEYFIENYTKDDDFVSAETRTPTSGKGLAYVVESVMAYSRNLEVPKRSRDVLSRFVNRTPKLRDSADCAITKAVQAVNWKNYHLDTYDNGLPKGPIKLLVNVSGPFVHLMFKSQSKNALADDEDLIKEIKYCLEAIGRRLRVYINRKASIRKSEKRASLIEKYIPIFVNSLYNIASQGESIHKSKLDKKNLEVLMRDAIGKKPKSIVKPLEIRESKEVVIKKEELIEETPEIQKVEKKVELKKELFTEKTLKNWTKNELIEYCKEYKIPLLSKDTKTIIIGKIIESYKKPVEEKVEEIKIPEPVKISSDIVLPVETKIPKSKIKPPIKEPPKKITPLQKPTPPKQKQTTLPIITTERILNALSDEWQTIKHLIFKLKIKDMMDARYLQLKLKELERKGHVLVESKVGKRQWKLKK
ncbi:MAG: DNA topoisomerase VI subunit B [Promethearchaeota archaeon]|nr:MAG: DNA topoisomerase VI subunit B [Candidatus Lokiarchaeota archaeon]